MQPCFMMHLQPDGLCEIDKDIKFMITTNFDLQNQPPERGVDSQPLALPHDCTRAKDITHYAHPFVPVPQLHSSSQALLSLLKLKTKMIQGKKHAGRSLRARTPVWLCQESLSKVPDSRMKWSFIAAMTHSMVRAVVTGVSLHPRGEQGW